MLKFDLSNDSLFGNEVAEDEIDEVFSSYAVERQEVKNFVDPNRRIAITRAYKGEGKSALLRLVKLRLEKAENPPLIINITASAISPEIESTDSDRWIRQWQINILKLAAREIGAHVSYAFSDDAITLLEEAESQGFRSRSFVSTILDRLKSSALPIERTRIGVKNPEMLLKRWSQNGSDVWFIIDDIDFNFENNQPYKTKVATFFTAIRHITNLIPEFKFRASIRPNIWAIIKREYEALSHVEQYIDDISWSLDDSYILLARRIEGYLKRSNQWEEHFHSFPQYPFEQRSFLIEQLFSSPVPWGRNATRPVAVALFTLSRRRPRWLIELCKEAASKKALNNKFGKISFDDITDVMESFSKRRVDDTIVEFKSQCPEMEDLLAAFAGQVERLSTGDLMTLINNRILQSVNPRIAGVVGKPTAREVAQFLYQIGFLTARKDLDSDQYEHVAFADNPTLLNTTTNIDQGYLWEIHPVFRQALKLKNSYEIRDR